MADVQLIGVAPCYNEIQKGHLERFIRNAPKIVDGMIILDDASTDGSYERLCEVFPTVLRNKKNMFTRELFNQQRLIDTALEVYPNLTHILNMNIDTTFTPACFKDGPALLHKACTQFSNDYPMFFMREVHLWRSSAWWRCDGAWRWKEAERIYVRREKLEIKNKWYKGLHVSKDVADYEQSLHLTNVPGFHDVLGVHWGFSTRRDIEAKVRNYLSLEDWRSVPCPEVFKAHSVYSLLDEYNLSLRAVHPAWFGDELTQDVASETRKPKQISYYPLLVEYNVGKAECYRNHFKAITKFYNEAEEYYGQ
jgi:hypothetical protein